MIPAKYTCDGDNVSPPLVFEDIPPDAKSLALIVDDPDAPGGIFVHWTIWNIQPQTKEIAQGSIPQDAEEGMTDFGRTGYGGPCPPSGTHRYFFKLYALDAELNLPATSRKVGLEQAMEEHLLDQAGLVGLYSRQK